MRRILVKLLAVSAFLDRRRSCTPPSAPMMTLLLRETSAALEAPLQQDSDRLRTLSRQWKRIILKWENDFERKNGVKVLYSALSVAMACFRSLLLLSAIPSPAPSRPLKIKWNTISGMNTIGACTGLLIS